MTNHRGVVGGALPVLVDHPTPGLLHRGVSCLVGELGFSSLWTTGHTCVVSSKQCVKGVFSSTAN